MKIRLVRAELFHADGQIDMTKLTVAFRNISNASKNRLTSIKYFKFKVFWDVPLRRKASSC
jgi:hypothetical protein